MATVFDVAQYILNQAGEMTAMKLQKLVYYSQAWHLAWTDDVLFDERIEAWRDGPVVPALYDAHAGRFRVTRMPRGRIAVLTDRERRTIDKVLKYYGKRSPQWLSDLTHMEDPWRDARVGTPAHGRGNREITPASMLRYYSSL